MSAPTSNRKLTQLLAGPDLFAVVAGGLLVWVSLIEPRLSRGPLQFTAPVLLAAGLLLAGWGLRTVAGVVWGRLGGWVWQGGRRYRVHFRREAVVYIFMLLVLCLGALLGHSNMLMLVFGLMVGPFVLGGQVTRLVLNRLQVTRLLPEHAVAGQSVTVRLELTNRKRLLSAWMVTAADCLASATEQQHPAVLFARVPPRGQRTAGYTVWPARRGVYRFGPVRVSCNFPLGLMERSFELGATQELLVLPRIGRLTDRWRNRERHGAHSAECAQARTGIFDDEFHRLREYRGGDNPRAIHWRTTARRNELMVREYQHHRWPALVLALDLWQPAHPSADDLLRVELAASFAATLCIDSARAADDAPIRLIVCGQTNATVVGAGHASSLQLLLETLAHARAGAATDLAGAGAAARAIHSPSRRLLVTTRPPGDHALQLLETAAPVGYPTEQPVAFDIVHADPQMLAPYIEFDETPEAASP